jgi:DNA-binding NarL/FixJ family response regulator
VDKAPRTRQAASILIADDHGMFAEALRKLLEDEHEVVGIVGDGYKLVEEAARLRPQILVVDFGMPLLNGLDAAKRIREQLPEVKIVFLTMQEDPRLAAAALKLGAIGFVLKHSAASELLTAISEVQCGKSYITPKLREQDWAVRDELAKQLDKELTSRQREVLQLLAEGRTMKEVAYVLKMSRKTVMFHKYRIMKIFNLKTSADLLRLAMKNNLMSQ